MPVDDSVATGRSQEVAQSALEVLALLARALIILSRSHPRHAFVLPYPSMAQSALDQIVLRCVVRQTDPPESLPALINWCRRRTIGELPVDVPAHVVTPDARLLSPRAAHPTRTCVELASYGPHGLVEQEAVRLLTRLADGCPSAVLFRECRTFLRHHPVVLRPQDQDVRVWEHVHHVYARAGSGLLVCSGCGLPATRTLCEREECGRETPPPRVRAMPEGTLLLDPALRAFLCLPAPTERTVLETLTERGIEVELHDLGRSLFRLPSPPNVEPRLLGVYDRRHPALLAARVSEFLSGTEATLTVAVPDHHFRRRGFRAAFETCLDVTASPRVVLTSPEDLGGTPVSSTRTPALKEADA
ncbi:hypothetical protein ABZY31_14930 [Streptomyces sp. NPDC006529]|uniref:pPIWI_RE_Y domain-containing protein n=1 Tax=Streptomyces sp. NPDC006529 TaxID=3157177 RepID=UPI0033B7799D